MLILAVAWYVHLELQAVTSTELVEGDALLGCTGEHFFGCAVMRCEIFYPTENRREQGRELFFVALAVWAVLAVAKVWHHLFYTTLIVVALTLQLHHARVN